jgi:TetR/AcrR family transcriptional repressor of nem operon
MMESDTRTRLLDAAQDLVQRVGANAMSYQHLADVVGIRKASIHHHFPTKSDLLCALIDRYHDTFMGAIGHIVAGRGDGASQFRRYCGLFEATVAQRGQQRACPCGMLGAEIATLAPAAAARLQRFYRANAEALGALLERGRSDGSLRFGGDARALAGAVFALLEGAMLVARVDGGPAAMRSHIRQLERLLGADGS